MSFSSTVKEEILKEFKKTLDSAEITIVRVMKAEGTETEMDA